MLLFTVVILPRRDCDFYRKSLQTGLRWWEVETHTHMHRKHIHSQTHTHTHVRTGVYKDADVHSLIKYKACAHTLRLKVRTDLLLLGGLCVKISTGRNKAR